MMTKPTLIFDLEGNHLLAVEAIVEKGRARVERAVTAVRVAAGEERDDPGSIGRWIRGVLDEHGFRAKRAIVSVSRGEALIKRLEIPVGSLSETERHEVIRLQMARQASLTSAESVIDYVSMDGEGEAGGALTVTAAAMPSERVEWRREIARSAGLRLTGIRLRSAGVRAVLASAGEHLRPVLVIAPGCGSFELLVIESGRLVFSRSIDAPMPTGTDRESHDVYADRVAVEASRTWMSYRVSPEGKEVERLVVLGAEPLGGAISDAVSERLELPAEILTPGDLFDTDEGVERSVLTPVVPLAGLLLCGTLGIPVLDFANPRAAPDTRAVLRQAALGGVLLLILFGGAGFLLANRDLGRQRAALETLKQENSKAIDRYVAAQLEGARLGHIRAWTDSSVDWLAHLDAIVGMMPDPTQAALSELGVTVHQRARFRPGAQLNDMSAWEAEAAVVVRLSGGVRDRTRAQAFRQSLLDAGVYRVESQGPELEDRFSLQISTASARAPGRSGGTDETGAP